MRRRRRRASRLELEGQGLHPGSCAWVDRALSDAEPGRIQLTIGATDFAPEQTVRDSGMYWGFLAYDSGSEALTGVGYRHWHASAPPEPSPPLLVQMRDGRRIAEASGDKLTSDGVGAAPATARR